ncbi:BrnT family toxin [Thauera butanivorans]|nr:BrnT family toxin [Thauera butanivorans]
MKITFDPTKNRTNIRKHRVDLADVEAVFHDPAALT